MFGIDEGLVLCIVDWVFVCYRLCIVMRLVVYLCVGGELSVCISFLCVVMIGVDVGVFIVMKKVEWCCVCCVVCWIFWVKLLSIGMVLGFVCCRVVVSCSVFV